MTIHKFMKLSYFVTFIYIIDFDHILSFNKNFKSILYKQFFFFIDKCLFQKLKIAIFYKRAGIDLLLYRNKFENSFIQENDIYFPSKF